jgi:hypothetical protein
MISKHLSFLVILSFFNCSFSIAKPVGQISSKELSKQLPTMKSFLFIQNLKRNLIFGAGCGIGALFLKYASGYALTEHVHMQAAQAQVIEQLAKNQLIKNQASLGQQVPGASGVMRWVQSLPETTGSLFHTLLPAVLVNLLISQGLHKLQEFAAAPFQDHSIVWYLKNYAPIEHALSIVKVNAAHLDLDSFYLDFKTNQLSQKVALKKFMQDVKGAVDNQDDFLGSFSPAHITNKYIRQAGDLEGLEDTALFVAAKKMGKKYTADGCNQVELEQQIFARHAIHAFTGKIKQDVEKLLAFIVVRYPRLTLESPEIQWLIKLANGYFADVEILLNMSDSELAVASREQRGLFTKSFEFDRQFKDALKTMQAQLAWQ